MLFLKMDPGLHSEHGRRGGGAPLRRDRVPRHRRRQLPSGLLRLETHAAVVGPEKRKNVLLRKVLRWYDYSLMSLFNIWTLYLLV